jgi:hypothetical protein
VQFINVGALAGTKAQVVQADALLLERGSRMLGRRRADPDRRASADAVISRLGVDDRLQPKKRGSVRNSTQSEKYARCR